MNAGLVFISFALLLQFDQIAHGMKSMQLDDEDASKYFINYISDEPNEPDSNPSQHEQVHVQDDTDGLDLTELPSSLIITSVPQDLFTNQQMKVWSLLSSVDRSADLFFLFKDEFEQLFRVHDSQIIVLYLKFFQRVRITFTSSHTALQARLHLHEYVFHGHPLKTYFASVSLKVKVHWWSFVSTLLAHCIPWCPSWDLSTSTGTAEALSYFTTTQSTGRLGTESRRSTHRWSESRCGHRSTTA